MNRAPRTSETVTEVLKSVSLGSKKKKRKKIWLHKLFKRLMTDNLPNLAKHFNLHIQEAKQTQE